MKKYRFILFLILLGFVYTGITSCRKKEKGNCYCKYVSGDKTHYDLTSLPRAEQEDSYSVLNNNASAFAGDCKLK